MNRTKKREKQQPIKKTLIDYFPNKWKDNNHFQELIIDYEQHRKQKNSKMTIIACERLTKKLTKWSIQKACKAIELSLESGYTGVFEPNGSPKNSNRTKMLEPSDGKYKNQSKVIHAKTYR